MKRSLLFFLLFGCSVIRLFAQPLATPYTFSFPAEVTIDPSAFNADAASIGDASG